MAQKGKRFEPTQVSAQHGRCVVCTSSVEGVGGDGGSEGRENKPTKNDTRDGMLTFFYAGSLDGVEWRDFWPKRSFTRLNMFKSPSKKIQIQRNGSGGMVQVGWRGQGASPLQQILGSKPSCTGKIITNSNSEGGSGGM